MNAPSPQVRYLLSFGLIQQRVYETRVHEVDDLQQHLLYV